MATSWKHLVVTSALVLSLGFCFERPVYGYVDPGSSLLAYQSFSAVITGALFYFRHRLKSLFRKSQPGSQTSSQTSPESQSRKSS
ncbi:MAG: hypothetical protein JWM43_2767 [Acidobacteriaceae bacterium]|nr:hypothetical protein [Acidobacteriaceae bacterium]